MKRPYKLLFCILCLSVLFSCQRESEVTLNQPAVGVMSQSSNGQCNPSQAKGFYVEDTVLNATHTLDVYVNVEKTGRYFVSTDSLNGFYFKDSGVFRYYGPQLVTLKGYGAPDVPGLQTKSVSFNGSVCYADIFVAPPGSGIAAYNTNCSGTQVSGTYQAGVYSTSDDKIILSVNVINPGAYNLQSPIVNGISFRGAGMLTGTGAQQLALTAQGTPYQPGSFTYSVGGCNVVVTFT